MDGKCIPELHPFAIALFGLARPIRGDWRRLHVC